MEGLVIHAKCIGKKTISSAYTLVLWHSKALLFCLACLKAIATKNSDGLSYLIVVREYDATNVPLQPTEISLEAFRT